MKRLLGVIQMRNFCVNKTTNERFARRANTVLSDSGSSRASSRTSSMVSVTTDQSMEQLLDGSARRCGWMFNCYQMCCNRGMVDQVQLFKNQAIQNDPMQVTRINQSNSFSEEDEEITMVQKGKGKN